MEEVRHSVREGNPIKVLKIKQDFARYSAREGNPEIQIVYDRDRLNFHKLRVADIVRRNVLGKSPVKFKGLGDQIDIRVQMDVKGLTRIENLGKLVVNPEGETPVFLE